MIYLRILLNTIVSLFTYTLPKKYVIRKGRHYSTQTRLCRAHMADDTMKCTVKFNASALYTSKDRENQWDTNKLWGFTEGFKPTYNSARIGWYFVDGALYLKPFTHICGSMNYDLPSVKIPFDTDIPCSIKVSGLTYVFNINGEIITSTRCANAQGPRFQLFPYFGGNEKAPHTITIFIK